MSFSSMTNHLADDARRQTLARIERELKEHPFPPQLVIENTSYCNLTCIHCSHAEMTRKPRHMERALWNSIVEEVGRTAPDCEVWPTFYGEALILGDELWDRLNYAKECGCRNLVLNSNGTLLGRFGNIDKVLDSPLKRFILSLDGLKPETFEKVRRKAKWDKVYPAVEELCRKRQERGQVYPTITAQFSVLPDNAAEVEDYRAYWHERGAEVKIRPMLEWGRAGSVRTDTIGKDGAFRIACPWANNTMAIHADGRVVACAIDYDANFTVGNVADSSVAAMWQALKTGLRDPHRSHQWDRIPALCQNCGDWQTAGAEYEPPQAEATRPFWYRPPSES